MVEPFGDDDRFVGVERSKCRIVSGPVNGDPDGVGPVETSLDVDTKGRSKVGKSKSDRNFAGDRAALSEQLADCMVDEGSM